MHSGTHEPPAHFCPAPHVTPMHGSTQLPPWQSCPAGHVAPAHESWHVPPLQYWPAGHVTPTQSSAMQRSSGWHERPDAQRWHVQASLQTPSTHTMLLSHVTPEHGSTQRPARHTCE